jgi:hypothetical protein
LDRSQYSDFANLTSDEKFKTVFISKVRGLAADRRNSATKKEGTIDHIVMRLMDWAAAGAPFGDLKVGLSAAPVGKTRPRGRTVAWREAVRPMLVSGLPSAHPPRNSDCKVSSQIP